MPTSRPTILTYLGSKILSLKPNSILDIGIGFGGKGMLFREYTDIWSSRYYRSEWKTRIDGVEIFEDYIGVLQREIYDNIFIGDAFKMEFGYYDFIYIGDVMVCVTKEEGLTLLNKLKAKHIMVVLPTKIPTLPAGPYRGNVHDCSITTWTPDEFKSARVLFRNDEKCEIQIKEGMLIVEYIKKT